MRIRLSAALLLLLAGNLLQAQPFGPVPWPKPLPPVPDTATLVFIGDVMMHREQIANARRADGTYDFSSYFSLLEGPLREADLAVANMEFTLGGQPYTGYPCFSAPDGYADYVADCGVDIFLTANNHILDKGKAGLERTLGIYARMERERGIRYTGTAQDAREDTLRNPLIVDVKGIRIALVNFTYGTNLGLAEPWPKVWRTDTAALRAVLGKARKASADFIVALPHWGTEYVLRHAPEQQRLARWLASEGCDAVVGTHPHVVQDLEILTLPNDNGIGTRDIPILYSLGNAISNMSAVNTRIGLMATLRFVKYASGRTRLLPAETTFTWCARPGMLTGGYTSVPVRAYSEKKEAWLVGTDFENMRTSYERVKEKTGIRDGRTN